MTYVKNADLYDKLVMGCINGPESTQHGVLNAAVVMFSVDFADAATVKAKDAPKLLQWIADKRVNETHLAAAIASEKLALHFVDKYRPRHFVHVYRASFITLMREGKE